MATTIEVSNAIQGGWGRISLDDASGGQKAFAGVKNATEAHIQL
jgi:hypothetical protein